MKQLPIVLLLTLLIFAVACTSGDRQQRLAQLEELERQNVADSLMTNDSLAQALADFFDRHGTSNERMRAHYILGRTYADLGEAPAALNAYLDAATCADTTAQDCDWAKLSRVYGQMADVFYKQNLMEDFLEANSHSVYYAWKAYDTLQAVRGLTIKVLAYDRRDEKEIVCALYDSLYKRFHPLGVDGILAQNSIIPVRSFMELGRLDKAKFYLNFYETQSGFFDSLHNIENGREAFYYYKGDYYLRTHQYDSAKYYFYKELKLGKDFMNQNMAAYGLAFLFLQTNQFDSAAKSAVYSYKMNDSLHAQMSMQEVKKAKAMYDYNRNKLLAEKEHRRAEQKERLIIRLLFLIFVILLLSGYAYWRNQKRMKAGQIAFLQKVEELEKAENEVVKLRTHAESMHDVIANAEQTLLVQEDKIENLLLQEEGFLRMIAQKEQDVERYQTELSELRRRYLPSKESAEQRLKESPLYQLLHKKADAGKGLSAEELSQLHRLVIELVPNFYQFISDKAYALNEHEYNAAILFRLHVNASSIGIMLNVSPSAVTKFSKSLMKKLFNEAGNSKELAEKLAGFC